MSATAGKNILIVIPKNQFDEQELFGVRAVFEERGARTVVLSQKGQEAVGMNKKRFQPDGMIVDWNKQEGISGKYHAVVVIGGRGSSKSLWDDSILPQILMDHYRAGGVIGAIGSSVAVLARASFLKGEKSAGPEEEKFLKELEAGGAIYVDQPVTRLERIVTAKGGEAAREFAESILQLLK